jgi:hypothetical protein
MYQYSIQQRIRTLADNAVDVNNASFIIDNVTFIQWEFNHSDGWLGDAWLAQGEVSANDIQGAYDIFASKLRRIVPRISLVGQTYIRSKPEPFFIKRQDKDFGFIYFVQEDSPVGLMFMEEQRKALDVLLEKDISDEFFFYWNDAVNTTGYTAKLLLMAAAIEALIKRPNRSKDFELRKQILGDELDHTIFAQRIGLRHRLSHGEYLPEPDSSPGNYVVAMHDSVIKYFNDVVFDEKLLSENVVSPQRNFTDNHSIGKFYLKAAKYEYQMSLKEILESYKRSSQNDMGLTLDNYNYVHGTETDNY